MTINNCKLFNKEKDLEVLTGLNHEQLWERGFDLDDWDYGFCCETKLNKSNGGWLLNQMEDYCCGYNEVYFNGNYYYMVYHS